MSDKEKMDEMTAMEAEALEVFKQSLAAAKTLLPQIVQDFQRQQAELIRHQAEVRKEIDRGARQTSGTIRVPNRPSR